ncbi:MAG: dTMP kinase [Melioribacteraceae bacterium]|nr:dTMP kinase [Melioribacteraceae bacterium]MDD3557824.1 dTMP kinase [Melioribacteraceae bacterium]
MLITFEGLDFCGKSTQIKLLKDYLENKKQKTVLLIREPGGTNISEKVRELLLDKKNKEMFIETELLLFSASRAQLVRQIIIPEIRKGNFVLSDRFHDSSIAYQGYGRGLKVSTVKDIQSFAIGDALPSVTFFIDIPIEEFIERRDHRKGSSLDRIENSDIEFYQKVREGYLKLCNEEERFVLINGINQIEEVHNEIISYLNQKIFETEK